ncbi:MAG: hypothetical protein H7832_01440 [Magnetococcus sp. DMHC-6]
MELVDEMTERFIKKNKLFVSKSEFFVLLGAKLCQQLAITKQTPVDLLTQALLRHCGNAFRVMKGGRYLYIARNLADDVFLLDKIQRQTKPFTVKAIGQNLPLTVDLFYTAFTQLLERQEVRCIALRKSDGMPLFQTTSPISEEVKSAPPPPSLPPQSDRQSFHQACLKSGQGRNFIFIHQIRSHLGWERKRFDQVLQQLHSDGLILLNMGDPTQLSATQLRNSFQDSNGFLYLTLNWLEPHA